MRIARSSAWSREVIDSFLEQAVIPVRLAVLDETYPAVCSIWFEWDAAEGMLWCASHESSKLIRLLQKNPHCAFEIAPNDPPYKGVRGQGLATLRREGAAEVLSRLITRYQGNTGSPLAKWLLSRQAGEFAIGITPVWLSAWDYSKRMAKSD